MKKILSLMLVLTLVIAVFAGCGNKNNDKTDNGTNTDTNDTNDDKKDDETTGEKKKVLDFVVNNLGDFGFGDLGWEATQAVAEKYNLDAKVLEAGVDTSTFVTSLLDAIETGGYSYVISPAWYVTDALLEKANTDFKDITFVLFDTSPDLDLSAYDNVIGINYQQNEGSFLVGVYSAMMSTTGKVGAIAGSDSPVLNDFVTGYVNGVKWYNDTYGKNVEYVPSYIGALTIQSDYETANVLYDAGVDVLYNIAGSVTLGAAQAAEEHGGFDDGKLVIGVDADQWNVYKNATGTDVEGYMNLSTSMLKKIKETVQWAFDGINDGTIEYGNHLLGIKDNGVGLAKNDNYKTITPQEVQDEIEKVEAMVTNGEIEIKSYYDFASYEEFVAYRDDQSAR